jgi:hypothetical protein
MAKKPVLKFLPLVFLCSLAFADEDLPDVDIDLEINKRREANQRVSIYFHPFSLFLPAFYLTIEYPLSKHNSIIINPSMWFFSKDFGAYTYILKDEEHFRQEELFRLGSGIGIRRFEKGISEGRYFQLMSSVHYLKIHEYDDESNDYSGPYKTYSGLMADLLGYFGYSIKSYGGSLFFDYGLGYRWANAGSRNFFGNNGIAVEFNIGLGFALF